MSYDNDTWLGHRHQTDAVVLEHAEQLAQLSLTPDQRCRLLRQVRAGQTAKRRELTPAELESVLESFSPAVEALPHLERSPIGDLKPQELERVLRSLEG